MMLEEIPEVREHMERVAAISPVWAALAERWEEVEASFLSEVGRDCCNGYKAPETYRLMRKIIDGVYNDQVEFQEGSEAE
jgi:hypothetical protein